MCDNVSIVKYTDKFVVHEHHATNVHLDLGLKCEDRLKYWWLPEMISMKPNECKPINQSDDHPLSTLKMDGIIPEGKSGAGEKRIWDKGGYYMEGNLIDNLKNGEVRLTFHGQKLKGEFILLKINRINWKIIKVEDKFSDKGFQFKSVIRKENEDDVLNLQGHLFD